ncbi:MAG: GNAT family N-acetyltransferase [Planctomycetota bacterium]
MTSSPAPFRIRVLDPVRDDLDPALELVQALLDELGDEARESGRLDRAGLAARARSRSDGHSVFLAEDAAGRALGTLTLVETFAFYAGGAAGIINELYVRPEHRSDGVGAALIAAAAERGRERGWRRIDVAIPEDPRWTRTRVFYEREGFVFAGPKLKLLLAGNEDGNA